MDSLLIKNVTKHTEIKEKLKKIDFFNKNGIRAMFISMNLIV